MMNDTTGDTLRQYSMAEIVIDGIIHMLAIIASIAGVTLVFAHLGSSLPAVSLWSLAVYSTGLIAVFVVSAIYNLAAPSRFKALMQRFDQAMIYVKIAATYTPFVLVKMNDRLGLGLLVTVWLVGLFGIAVKLFFPHRLIRTTYALYLVQGWSVVLVLSPLAAVISERALLLLACGGLLYTGGIVFHIWRNLRFNNAIWHGFVAGGSTCHFFAILDTVALA
jgi:hemolysin III